MIPISEELGLRFPPGSMHQTHKWLGELHNVECSELETSARLLEKVTDNALGSNIYD